MFRAGRPTGAMTIIDQLRERGTERTSLATPDGVYAGYLNQPLLTEGAAYALLGETPETTPDEALVIALEDISAVTAA
jgi:hypothetical protein